MNVGPVRAALLGLALVLVAAGILAGANSSAAVPLATGAAVAVVAFAALSLAGATRFSPEPFSLPDADSLVALRSAFREGALGRQRVAAAIAELERETQGRRAIPLEDQVGLHPEDRSPEEFRRWVAERLDELEATT